jgi:restriction endonuclease S subunit
MQTAYTTKRYLKFSRFSELIFWDYYTLSNQFKIVSKFPIVRLKEVVKHRKEFMTIEDEKEYKRCRVQLYGRGVVLRDLVFGKKILTKKQQVCKEDDFLVAEIDAKFGGYGIVPSYLQGAIVSSHYFLFEIINKKLLPDFLSILLKCEDFSKQVKSTGSTNYSAIRPFHVLNYSIPLPTIDTQQKIAYAYFLKIDEAERFENEAILKKEEINDYLLDTLGVKIEKTIKKKGMTFVKSSLIDRWAVDYLFKLSSIKGIEETKYPVQKIRNFLLYCQYGVSLKATEEPIGIPMLRMNNIYNSELKIDDLKYLSLSVEQKKKHLLDKGDLLFNRTNSKELVGKTAIFELDEEFTFASYLIRLKLDTEKVNVHFINYLLNSTIGRTQIDMISRQVLGQANINAQELQDLIFPIPKLETQNKIVQEISKMKESSNSLKEKAELNRKEAIDEFEQVIFKN